MHWLLAILTLASSWAACVAPTNGTPRSGYSFARGICIDHTKVGGTDSLAFPVGVIGTFAYLAVTGSGGSIQHTVTSANVTVPADLVFTSDAAGTILLNWEVASYTSTTGAIEVYVNIATVSHTTDSAFYMSYGNAAVSTFQGNINSTWNSAFVAVYHFDNVVISVGKVTTTNDSTSNANNLSDASSSLTQVTGAVAGHAISSPDTSGHVEESAAQSTGLPTGSATRTLELWFIHSGNFTATGGVELAVTWGQKTTNQAWSLGGCTAAACSVAQQSMLLPDTFGNGATEPFTVDSALHYAVSGYPSGQTRTDQSVSYLNAVLQSPTFITPASTVNTVLNPGGGALCMSGGPDCDGSTAWIGTLDEVRISNVLRSADWITATFNNLNAPSTFITISAPATARNMPPVIF